MTAEAAVAIPERLWRLRLQVTSRRFSEGWRLFAQSRIGLVGIFIIAFYGLMAVAHPILMNTLWDQRTYDPVIGFDGLIVGHPSPPSPRHILGTDPLGRDVASMLMFSTQSEFLLGIMAAVVTVIVATAVGSVSAYFGGWIDALLMRLADLVIMMPGLSLLIVLGALFDLNFLTLAIAVGLISGLGGTSVIVKSQALTVKVKPYIEAARGAGGSHFHVITTHLVPNLVPLAFLYMMFTVTTAIFSEAVLSFFGILNIRMSWGIMIFTAQSSGYLGFGLDYWWLLIPAGVSITLLCGSFYLVGRGLDPVVNPRLRIR
ncbi:MAG: ABC transporter permease [Chloroflexi bacterium]|nr:ABC transporter permease [Chloroflexota bacterium]